MKDLILKDNSLDVAQEIIMKLYIQVFTKKKKTNNMKSLSRRLMTFGMSLQLVQKEKSVKNKK